MKGRLGSTIWTWVAINAVVLLAVVVVAYSAGAHSGGLPIASAMQAQGSTPLLLLIAFIAAIGMSLTLFIVFGNRVIKPVKELTDFSEKLAAGDYKAKAEVDSDDDFSAIAAAFNQTSEKVARAVLNQEAQESLQRSVTDFLTIVSQIGRGDLTLRGKVTNDALGNVVDSVNYMLDNFTRVLERVRKSAIDVASNANEILLSSEDMSAGATQQDQEITNTSSAVEELTVSMKQVSNNAEASAEAARRALDAAEQGNRAVRDTLEGMQRIRASVQATAKKIKSLGDRSLEISEIINVINDITEQTNLLALNAAIEA
ncbi:MAG: putative Methyl-accepting chemotaxis protein, partial [Acidobacteriaceae bacterium]|nr:putative Methyl-accepting chemotaxis protein [Acidobacteriaceae bacterium]